MAVDEALLESVSSTGVPVLRFYGWQEPTLSLGYFQAAASRGAHAASSALPLVRRSTGGGAIVHDRELTYTLVVPIRDRWGEDHRGLYRQIHAQVVDWLVKAGGRGACLHPGISRAAAEEPFLCFERRADGDVELAGFKVLGSAQRRTRTALLQHGSLLLARSSGAPELPGIAELLAGDHQAVELREVLMGVLIEAAGRAWTAGKLTDDELRGAERLERERFGAEGWTNRR